MTEKGENQPLKRIRFEEDDEDLISKLPDCLLAEILSHLPDTKYAIRTGTLSKRWEHIWYSVPSLAFQYPFNSYINPNPDYFSFINKTLTQRRQIKLKKFKLDSRFNLWAVPRIHNWIRYAVNCNVEDLQLWLWGLERTTEFPLDQFVFKNSCFTKLTLSRCSINPTGAISWKNLRSLRISWVKLDEGLIENILSGSPVLETLELNNCYGFERLNINSKSVKKLVLSGYMNIHSDDISDIIKINAPNILSLKIQDHLRLRNLSLLNVSSLVEAHLDYIKVPEKAKEEMLKRFILNLLHVKDLKIGTSCLKVLNRLKAKGFLSPSNLNVLDVTS